MGFGLRNSVPTVINLESLLIHSAKGLIYRKVAIIQVTISSESSKVGFEIENKSKSIYITTVISKLQSRLQGTRKVF